MKICTSCKHSYVKRSTLIVCTRNNYQNINPVNGSKYWNFDSPSCDGERSPDGRCGPSGIFYEKSNELFKIISGALKRV